MDKNRWILVALFIAFLVGFFMGTSNWSPATVANAQTTTTVQPSVAMQVNGSYLYVVRGDTVYIYLVKQNVVNTTMKDLVSVNKTTLK